MKVTLEWLREYVPFPESAEKLSGILSRVGFPVDHVDRVGEDDVLTLDVPANRGDALGVIGIAREVAAATGLELRLPSVEFHAAGPKIDELVRVEVEAPELCPRYIARVVLDVSGSQTSPLWMQRRLQAVGLRPISRVVDITNYVLWETGQPLHAFDLKMLKGQKVIVRKAKEGEVLELLDGRRIQLTPATLVIADAERPQALAGIMGGSNSGVGPSTRHVLVESAFFAPLGIRSTSRQLGIATPSSLRFERGADYDMTEWASRRAVHLMVSGTPARVATGVVDVNFIEGDRRGVALRFDHIAKVLGVLVSRERVQRTLVSLGYSVSPDPKGFRVGVPSWRRDVSEEVDVIEDIARIEGYDRIPSEEALSVAVARRRKEDVVAAGVKERLVAAGYYEYVTWSIRTKRVRDPGIPWFPEPVCLRNPDGTVSRWMRGGILASLLDSMAENERYRERLVPCFELGRVYGRENQAFAEKTVLGALDPRGYRHARGVVEMLAREFQVALRFTPADLPGFRSGSGCRLSQGDRSLGYIGIVDPSEAQERSVSLKEPAGFEIDWAAWVEACRRRQASDPLPRTPAIRRDLAILVGEEVPWEKVEKAVRDAAPTSLRDVEIFDVYRGPGTPPGKKSFAFSIVLQNEDRTVTSEEADEALRRIVAAVEAGCGAQLRGSLEPAKGGSPAG